MKYRQPGRLSDENTFGILREGILMTLSQLLLTAFVIWWLFSQFHEEQALLKKNLYQEFTQVRDQVIDSVLVSDYINPILTDKKLKVHLNDEDTTLEDSERVVRKSVFTYYNKEVPHPGNDHMSVVLVDSGLNSPKGLIMHARRDSAKDILLHGFKLIVNEVTGTADDKKEISLLISSKADTILLKKLLNTHFEKNGWNFNTSWISNKNPHVDLEKSKIYFESGLFPYDYGVEISEFNSYLFSKMLPQILFALVLLSMTGIAFLISYRSLKNQMRLSTLKDDFISNMSHELKTPVTTVKIALEALQGVDISKNQVKSEDYLNIAVMEVNRLEQLIGQVLNGALMEKGKSSLLSERVDLSQLAEEVLQSLRIRFMHQNAGVQFIHSDKAILSGDKSLLQGVLLNLIDNSLKYAAEKPIITLRVWKDDHRVLLSLADNGPGIPEEYINNVFEKFFRVPYGDRHDVKGYGLGLSYAMQVMNQHHGTITVKNLPAGGCVFTLTFLKPEA